MAIGRTWLAAAGFAALLATGGTTALAAGETVTVPTPGGEPMSAEELRARTYFTDTLMTTHDGQQVRFYSDVLRGKTVVITFFYADCPDACPLINQILADTQEILGDQFGRDIRFVTITTDPDNDTPEKLAKIREAFAAREGWYFLTGDKAELQAVSKKLGQLWEREQHLTVFLAGNVNTARWRKIKPNTPPPALAEQLRELAADNGKSKVRTN